MPLKTKIKLGLLSGQITIYFDQSPCLQPSTSADVEEGGGVEGKLNALIFADGSETAR